MSSLDGLLDEVCPKCRPVVEVILKRVDELERRLARYENAHTPPSRRSKQVRRVKSGKGKPGRKGGHKGVTRPQACPDKCVGVGLAFCPECEGVLGEPVHDDRRFIEELPEPQPIEVTEYNLGHYDCPSCGSHVEAGHPDCPSVGRLGKRALAQISFLKYVGRLPCRKIVEVLELTYGLKVSAATVWDATRRVADSLQDEYMKVRARIRAGKVVYIDETSIKVDGVNYWIWTFTTTTDTLTVIRQSRGKKVLREVLGRKYKGVIVSDGLRCYASYAKNHQRCWAHILRDADHAAEKHMEAQGFSKAMHRLYKKLTKPPPEKRPLLHVNAKATLKRWTKKKYETPAVNKLARKVQAASNSLLTFLHHPNVEPTNNRAERSLREHVVIRKIIGTLRNTTGTRIHETTTTLITTWIQQGKNPYTQLQTHI